MKFMFSLQELVDLYKMGNSNIKKEVIQLSKEVLEKGGTVECCEIQNISLTITISSMDDFKKIENALNKCFIPIENP